MFAELPVCPIFYLLNQKIWNHHFAFSVQSFRELFVPETPWQHPELEKWDPRAQQSVCPVMGYVTGAHPPPADGLSWVSVGMSVPALGFSIPYRTEIPPRSKLGALAVSSVRV